MDFKPKPVHMFNSYTKLTTAFAAFALLFSTGVWSQCADPLHISVDYVITDGGYPSEMSWSLNDDGGVMGLGMGASVLSCVDPCYGGASGAICLAPGDYTFVGNDSWGDGWNGATATFTNSGTVIGTFSLATGFQDQVTFSVSADIPGCTDPAASNYNDAATVDDGSCCLEDLITINLFDSWGDGWVTNFDDGTSFAGGVEFLGVFYPFSSGSQLSLEFCLPAGCYGGTVTFDHYASLSVYAEGSWEILHNGIVVAGCSGNCGDPSYVFGGNVGNTANPYGFEEFDVFFYTDDGSCVNPGCMDDTQCNYDPLANIDDDSCELESCGGCMDPVSCNYDDLATLPDGSCDYSCVGCTDSTATNYDAAATISCTDCCSYCTGTFAGTLTVGGGSWASEIAWNLSLDGVVIASGAGAESSTVLCLEAGCYTFNMTDNYGDGWNDNQYVFTDFDGVIVHSGTIDTADIGDGGQTADAVNTDNLDFNGGACISACTDSGACNYDAAASFDDGSCDYSCQGCTDSGASNYDPNATVDNGSCAYCTPDFVFTLDLTDSAGDGWDGAVYTIYDESDNSIVGSGDLDTAAIGDGVSEGSVIFCLAPGCYTVQVTNGAYPSEVGLSASDQFGTYYGSISGGETLNISFAGGGSPEGCGFEGCTNPAANNFDVSASIDDGSCEVPPSNDLVANAEAVACGSFATGTLLYANDDSNLVGTVFGSVVVATEGVWYVYNAPNNEQVSVSTCATPSNDTSTDYISDTKVHLYTQAPDGSLVGVGANDDGCSSGFLSTAIFNASTGIDYFIYISRYAVYSGGNDFVLEVSCTTCEEFPLNDLACDATVLVNDVTFAGTTCCSSADAEPSIALAWGTPYGVWFSFNSSDYAALDFNLLNGDGSQIGMNYFEFTIGGGATCEELEASGGALITGQYDGITNASFNDAMSPNTDYYFCVFTTELDGCGGFDFTVSGVYYGCTDSAANNYDPNATDEDGTCDFTGVVPPNDTCSTAEALTCNTVTTGSTGGATNTGSPIAVVGCESSPGNGVWYSFVGDGQLHSISTCGSTTDTKMNIYTAQTSCGGEGWDVPVDACGEGLVTVNIELTSGSNDGSWDNEISWELVDALTNVVAFGGAPDTQSVCLPAGDYTLNMVDSFGDGWNAAMANFTDGLGGTLGQLTLEAGFSGTGTLTVVPFATDPTYIPGDFDCFFFAENNDYSVCSYYDLDDVYVQFQSTVGTLYYILVGTEGDSGTFDLEFTCEPVISGCMNSVACDYNPDANVPTACDFFSCVCMTGEALQVNMDAGPYGIGWQGATYTISNTSDGTILYTGDLDNALYAVDVDNYLGNDNGFDMVCLEPGCYTIVVSDVELGAYDYGLTWDITDSAGLLVVGGAAGGEWNFSIGGSVCGCTDDTACNYDLAATSDNGTCEWTSCAGCMDTTACNYDFAATISDPAACCNDNCVSVEMLDSFGDGWGGYNDDGDIGYVITNVDGVEVASGMLETGGYDIDHHCLPDGCYTIMVNEFTWSGEISWTLIGAVGGLINGISPDEQVFSVGSTNNCVTGCDISCACNYDAAVNIQDVTQCVFSGCDGCTYPDSPEYSVDAMNDDGSCTFEIANPCPADLNGDGSVTALDLLSFLAAFGTVC